VISTQCYRCADLTNVTAAPNNGTEGSLYHLLSSPPSLPAPSNGTSYVSGQYRPAEDPATGQSETIVATNNTACECSRVTSPFLHISLEMTLNEPTVTVVAIVVHWRRQLWGTEARVPVDLFDFSGHLWTFE